jgi:predicted enzyme related to lactoylglutathione lyase
VSVVSRFVWFDLMTTDLAASAEFLQALLGYELAQATVNEDGVQYYMMTPPGLDEALFGLVPIEPTDGMRSHWIGYLTVDDVNDAVDDVREAGGAVHVPPSDDGEDDAPFAVVTDPQGAPFAPYRSQGEVKPPGELAEIGRVAWFELMTTDVDAAANFYGEIVGWQVGDSLDLGEQGAARPLSAGGSTFGLVRNLLPGSATGPQWNHYIRVADLDATVALARELGGFLYEDPLPLGKAGRRATILDPSGAPIAVWEAAKS